MKKTRKISTTKKTVHEILVDYATTIRNNLQQGIEDSGFYCKNVTKKPWPMNHGYTQTVPIESMPIPQDSKIKDFGVTVHTIHLKKSAIHSPDICVADLTQTWQIEEVDKQTRRCLQANAETVWHNAFQNETLQHCRHHFITRALTTKLMKVIMKQYEFYGGQGPLLLLRNFNNEDIHLCPGISQRHIKHTPRVNFWGKRVNPYKTTATTTGYKAVVNPKYLKAAEQVIVWNPNIVEFQFPDLEHWVGDVSYRNVLSTDNNPNSTLGFYRLIMSYAAKPLNPDLGMVITVLPPGLKGWLWQWCWSLVGFKP